MPHKDPEVRRAYLREYHKRWYAENRTEKLAQNAEWTRQHWEEVKALARWKRANVPGQWEKEYAAQQRWQAKHPEYAGSKMRQYRLRVINHIGAKCSMCGTTDARVLQVDHVNGGGTIMRRFFKNQQAAYYTAIWEQIQKGSDQYQVLCANCNIIKRWDEREWGDGGPSLIPVKK